MAQRLAVVFEVSRAVALVTLTMCFAVGAAGNALAADELRPESSADS